MVLDCKGESIQRQSLTLRHFSIQLFHNNYYLSIMLHIYNDKVMYIRNPSLVTLYSYQWAGEQYSLGIS